MEQVNNQKENTAKQGDFDLTKGNKNILDINDYPVLSNLQNRFKHLNARKVDYLKSIVYKKMTYESDIVETLQSIKKPLEKIQENKIISEDDNYVLELMCQALIDLTINTIASDDDLLMTLRIKL